MPWYSENVFNPLWKIIQLFPRLGNRQEDMVALEIEQEGGVGISDDSKEPQWAEQTSRHNVENPIRSEVLDVSVDGENGPKMESSWGQIVLSLVEMRTHIIPSREVGALSFLNWAHTWDWWEWWAQHRGLLRFLHQTLICLLLSLDVSTSF